MAEYTKINAPAISGPLPAGGRKREEWRSLLLHPLLLNLGAWLIVLSPLLLTGLAAGGSNFWDVVLFSILPSCLYFALPIYTHGFLLLPFLYRGQYMTYLLLFAGNVFLWSGLVFFFPEGIMLIRGSSYLVHAVLVGGVTFIGALIKIAKDALMRIHENRQAELQRLKEQLNPHFLFNTMNNLYGLSVQKSEKLPGLMLQLSDLLRYSLYDTREPLVSLEKEMDYLKNYIELERLRLDNRAQVRFNRQGDPSNRRIAPLLLIVFVENCFKHLSSRPGAQAKVEVAARLEGHLLYFSTRNSSWRPEGQEPPGRKGIGLNNARQRLQLLYPGRHELSFKEEGEMFCLELKLKLT